MKNLTIREKAVLNDAIWNIWINVRNGAVLLGTIGGIAYLISLI